MTKGYDDYRFDQRLIALNLRREIITKEEYDKYMKTLPDLKNQSDEISPVDIAQPAKGDSGDLTFSVA